MIITECVYCNNPLFIPLNEDYLDEMKMGRAMVSKEVCDKCGKQNFVEHKRIGGETFGEEDERAKRLKPLPEEK